MESGPPIERLGWHRASPILQSQGTALPIDLKECDLFVIWSTRQADVVHLILGSDGLGRDEVV